MASLFDAAQLLDLLTLTGLEIILGIDNLIFIAILTSNLPIPQQVPARMIGLSLALIMRVAMLFTASWIMKMTVPLFNIGGIDFSGKSLMLLIGGLFLVVKSIMELQSLFSSVCIDHSNGTPKKQLSFRQAITQILFIDFIFSFDSIITAVGISNNLTVMIIAIVIAMIVMIVSANPIAHYIKLYPSIKILGLNFIMLIGAYLCCGGLGLEIDKAYLYFAMFFATFSEILNIKLTNKRKKYEHNTSKTNT
jgi:predicted tellurium resistance membrane protein TerC